MKTLVCVGFDALIYLVMAFRKIRGKIKKLLKVARSREGELLVVGQGHIDIDLPISGLDCVEVFFKEKCHTEHVPCDPGHSDSLSYHYHKKGKHWTLTIKWQVQAPATIGWIARY